MDDPSVREWLGRFLGRIHGVGRVKPYTDRPALDIATFGVEPRRYLLEGDWLPTELKRVYDGVSQQALDLVAAHYDRGAHHSLRLHGDCHEGNVLWTDSISNVGPHFVDFDDSRMGPAVQDFWMLLGAGRAEQTERLADLLEGYEDFAEFDRRELTSDRTVANAALIALLGLDRAPLGRPRIPGRVSMVQHAALLGRSHPGVARADRSDAGRDARRLAERTA